MPLSWTYRLHTTESYAFVLAQDVMSMGTNEVVKRYAGLNTLADLQKNCKELLNVYEVCRNEKIRVYFDVDKKRSDNDDECQILRETLKTLKGFMNSFGIYVKKKEFKILSACTEEKLSFHLILPHICFQNESTRKIFREHVRVCGSSLVDPAPYTRNCLFRCPLSSKLKKNNTLRPVNLNNLPLSDFVFDDYLLHTDEVFIHELNLRPTVACTPPSVSHVPANITPENVTQLIRQHGDETSVFYSMKSTPVCSFYFKTRDTRKCLSGSGCTHSRNNFFVYVGPDNVLIYKCLSPKCDQLQRILGTGDTIPAVQPIQYTTSSVRSVVYNERYCRAFDLPLVGGLQVIKSEMSTGKTYRVRELLEKNPDARTLIVCFRCELGHYMLNYLNASQMQFILYSNVQGTLQQSKLICQVNSLHRIYDVSYDFLILDEVESILAQFNGVCATKKRMCWLVLEKLIRDTKHVFALDAAIDERARQVLRSIRPHDWVSITNEYQTRSNLQMKETNMISWINEMFESINSNQAIAITSTNAKWLVALQKLIMLQWPSKKVLLIWSESTSEQKREFHSQLSEVDVFMYSATLQAGISIDILHFQRLFVYATSHGPTPGALHQMLARIRTLISKEIYITFDNTTLNTDLDEWTYDDMVRHVTTSIRVALDSRLMNDVGAVITGFAKDWSRVYADTPFFIGTVHNILESFNGERHYRKIFMRQALQKGYIISSLRHTWADNINEEARSMLKCARTELKNQKAEFYESILNAECDVDPQEFTENIKEKRQALENASNDASHAQTCKSVAEAEIDVLRNRVHENPSLRESLDSKIVELQHLENSSKIADKHAIQCEVQLRTAEKQVDSVLQKSILAKFYAIPASEITRKFLKQCEPSSSRDAYFRLCLTVPKDNKLTSQSIQNRITEVMHHEGANLTSSGIMYAIDHMQKFTNGIKLALCHQMLHDIGFEHIFDKSKRSINYDYAHKSLHCNVASISQALELKSTVTIENEKTLVQFCNMILRKCYKASIKKCPKRDQVSDSVLYKLHLFAFPDVRFVPSCSEFVSADMLARAKLRA